MESRALILALALTIPLVLYGIPYAYAATTTSSYVVTATGTANPSSFLSLSAHCNPGDFATGGGFTSHLGIGAITADPTGQGALLFWSRPDPTSGTPTAWSVEVSNPTGTAFSLDVYVVCQTPITVAGIGVPQFGSLYILSLIHI